MSTDRGENFGVPGRSKVFQLSCPTVSKTPIHSHRKYRSRRKFNKSVCPFSRTSSPSCAADCSAVATGLKLIDRRRYQSNPERYEYVPPRNSGMRVRPRRVIAKMRIAKICRAQSRVARAHLSNFRREGSRLAGNAESIQPCTMRRIPKLARPPDIGYPPPWTGTLFAGRGTRARARRAQGWSQNVAPVRRRPTWRW